MKRESGRNALRYAEYPENMTKDCADAETGGDDAQLIDLCRNRMTNFDAEIIVCALALRLAVSLEVGPARSMRAKIDTRGIAPVRKSRADAE